jgi:hypothetical protein
VTRVLASDVGVELPTSGEAVVCAVTAVNVGVDSPDGDNETNQLRRLKATRHSRAERSIDSLLMNKQVLKLALHQFTKELVSRTYLCADEMHTPVT